MIKDEEWMILAIKEADKARLEGEVPVGAVLVKNNKLLSQGHNQAILKNDATAHAEIQVMRYAGNIEKNYRLLDTTLYVTLEPCIMCFSAMVNARINRIVFGAFNSKKDSCESCEDLNNLNCFQHKIQVTGGILENKCKHLLNSFFKPRR